MLTLLAETERDQALAEGYFLIFWIALIGLVGVLVIVGVIALRRATRRSLDAIEHDRAERRAAKSAGRVDAWSAGAERYVDHDKLPEQVPYDTEPDAADLPPEDGDEGLPDPPPEGDEQEQDAEPEDDPYGLFEDKPYRDPEDEDDEDEEEWGDGDEEDGRR